MSTTRLQLERILVYYDIPQLFIATDQFSRRYLCLLFEEDRYLAINTNQETITLLVADQIDLRTCYLEYAIDNRYYIVEVDEAGLYTSTELNEPEECMLPEDGFFVGIESDLEDIEVAKEYATYGKPIVHLGLVDESNSHSISLLALAQISANLQSMINHISKRLEDRNKLTAPVELKLFNSSAASFNLHLYADTKHSNLFQETEIGATLETIDKLLSCRTEQELYDNLKDLRGRASSAFRNFIRVVSEGRFSLKYKIKTSAYTPTISRQVLNKDMREVYELLSKKEELDRVSDTFEGEMLDSALTNGLWKLRTDDGFVISGSSINNNMLNGVEIGARYSIECEEITERDPVSLRDKVKYTLVKITPLNEH